MSRLKIQRGRKQNFIVISTIISILNKTQRFFFKRDTQLTRDVFRGLRKLQMFVTLQPICT